MNIKDSIYLLYEMKRYRYVIYRIIEIGNLEIFGKHKQIFSRRLSSLGGINNNKEPGPGPGRGRSSGRSSSQGGKQPSLSSS